MDSKASILNIFVVPIIWTEIKPTKHGSLNAAIHQLVLDTIYFRNFYELILGNDVPPFYLPIFHGDIVHFYKFDKVNK